MVLNYLFLKKSNMKKYLLIISTILISGCNTKATDFVPEGGKYFVDSLSENVERKDVEQTITLSLNHGYDIPYRYGSLSANITGIGKIYSISKYVNDHINIYSEPSIIGDNLIILNNSGILTKFKITSDNKILKIWQRSLEVDSASESSTGVKDNVVVISSSNTIIGLDLESGKQIWSTQIDSTIGSKPLFINNIVVFIAKNDAAYAIDYKSGRLEWYLPNIINKHNRALFSITPILIDNYIVQQTYDDQIRFINHTNGQVEFITTINNQYKHVKGKEFLNHYGNIAYDSYEKVLYLNNSNGEIVKLRIGANQPDWIIPSIVSKPLWLLDNIIISLNDLGDIAALSKSDGKIIWSNNIIKKITNKNNEKDIFGKLKPYNTISFTPPIVIDGEIIIISSNNKLIRISPENGTILDVKDYQNDIFGLPFIHNNKVFIIKNNGSTIMQL